MKKTLLMMAVALLACTWAYGQDEEVTTPVHKKALTAVLADAKFIVADSHYTEGRTDLQSAISNAESQAEVAEDDATVREILKELQGAIDAFVEANSPVDATEKVQNPSFDKDATNATTITGWTTTNFKENARTPGNPSTSTTSISQFTEQWVNATQLSGSGDMHQEVTNLPVGHFRLTADVFVISQKTDTLTEAVGVELYFNDQVREIGLTDVLSGVNAVNFALDTDIAEGESLTIGLRFANTNVNWLGWDNVRLLYIGSQDDYDAIVNAEKLAAARETLNGALTAARTALANENAPFYRTELSEAIETAESFLESNNLTEIDQATSDLNAVLSYFNGYNRYYTNLLTAIEQAEALLAEGKLTEGTADFEQAIAAARNDLNEAATTYVGSPEEAVVLLGEALTALQQAEASFRVRNASYSNPANVITNGDMSSTNGWDILVPGANPGLHINTSGNVTGFSKPFMECWVNNTDYGQENYARQTVNVLPDGQPLPKGYYVLKAAALATRQDQAGLQVSGVTLRLGDQSVDVHTANGVSNLYTLGYETQRDGEELTFGLFIDETTDANWIAWDEVELLFVGPKDKYLEDYAEAVLGESMTQLKTTLEEAKQLMDSVDPNGIDLTTTELATAIDEAQYIVDNPLEATGDYIEELIDDLEKAMDGFYTSGVSPKEGQNFDFTRFIQNADFDIAPTEEWALVEGVLPSGDDCPYWWFGGSTGLDLAQEFQQTIYDMPAGNYLLDVQASVRVDMNYSTANYTAENLPNNLTRCVVYANSDTTDVHPFFYEDEAQGLTLDAMLAMTNDYDYRHGNGTLIDYMLKESGLFHNYVPFTLDEMGAITVGFRIELPRLAGQMPFIDYFHLYFYGNQEVNTAITTTEADGVRLQAPQAIYNMNGQMMRRGTSLEGLPKGLYIVKGRKVVVR